MYHNIISECLGIVVQVVQSFKTNLGKSPKKMQTNLTTKTQKSPQPQKVVNSSGDPLNRPQQIRAFCIPGFGKNPHGDKDETLERLRKLTQCKKGWSETPAEQRKSGAFFWYIWGFGGDPGSNKVNNHGILVFGIFCFLVFLDISTQKKGNIETWWEVSFIFDLFPSSLYQSPNCTPWWHKWYWTLLNLKWLRLESFVQEAQVHLFLGDRNGFRVSVCGSLPWQRHPWRNQRNPTLALKRKHCSKSPTCLKKQLL